MTQALLFFGATSVEMHSNKFSFFGKSFFSLKILTIKWMHKYLNTYIFYSGKNLENSSTPTNQIYSGKYPKCLQFIGCAFLSRFQDQKKINGSHFSKGYWQHCLLGAPIPFVKQSLMQKKIIYKATFINQRCTNCLIFRYITKKILKYLSLKCKTLIGGMTIFSHQSLPTYQNGYGELLGSRTSLLLPMQ